jgi:lipopolysaccharide/colanic/teichoic acid biosynthesis glycosyltransferase
MDDFLKTKIIFASGFFVVLVTIGSKWIDQLNSVSIIVFSNIISSEIIYYSCLILLFLALFSYAFLFINDAKYILFRRIGDTFYILVLTLPPSFLVIFILQKALIPYTNLLSPEITFSILILILFGVFITLITISSKRLDKLVTDIYTKSSDEIIQNQIARNSIAYNFLKLLSYIIFGIITIYLMLQIIIVAIPLVKLESRGPAFFKQRRVGKENMLFDLYKIRTMKTYSSTTENLSNHITKVGNILRRTFVDEIPAIFNVIKGDLSLVGPRSLIPGIVNDFIENETYRKIYLSIKPGLISIATLNSHLYSYTLSENLKLDLYYIINRSICLDLMILLASFKKAIVRI